MMKSICRGGLKTKRENKRESTVAMEKIKVEHNFSNAESIFILFEIWRALPLSLPTCLEGIGLRFQHPTNKHWW